MKEVFADELKGPLTKESAKDDHAAAILLSELISLPQLHNQGVSRKTSRDILAQEKVMFQRLQLILGNKVKPTAEACHADCTIMLNGLLYGIQLKSTVSSHTAAYHFTNCDGYEGLLLLCNPVENSDFWFVRAGTDALTTSVRVNKSMHCANGKYCMNGAELKDFFWQLEASLSADSKHVYYPFHRDERAVLHTDNLITKSNDEWNMPISPTHQIEVKRRQAMMMHVRSDLFIMASGELAYDRTLYLDGQEFRVQDKSAYHGRNSWFLGTFGRQNGGGSYPYKKDDFKLCIIFKDCEGAWLVPSRFLESKGFFDRVINSTPLRGAEWGKFYHEYDENFETALIKVAREIIANE